MLLIKNVDLYAPEKLWRRDILLGCGKIMAITENFAYAVPDLPILDGAGRKCVPGLIDQHVHVTGGGGESGFASRVPELKLSDCIKAGVTTVVGLLGTDSQTRSVENLVAKTKALNAEGITAYCLTGAYDYPAPTISGDVSKDMLYINEVIGVKLAISDHRGPHINKDELLRLASQVRVAGLISGKVGEVHLHTGSEKQGLALILQILDETDIPASQFHPTHIRETTPGALAFAQRGGYLDFTSGRDAKATAQTVMHFLPQMERAHITISSDANGSQPVWNEKKELIGITAAKMDTLYATVLSLVNDFGLDLSEALAFVTVNVAQALQLYPQKGVIQPESDADLLLLDENNAVDTVIAKGKILMQDKKVLVKGLFE